MLGFPLTDDSAVRDCDGSRWFAVFAAVRVDLVNDLLAFDDMSEYHMLLIQERRSIGHNIKLTTISILFPKVRHSENIFLIMGELKTLIFERQSIHRLTSSTISVDDISALNAEPRYYSMERASFKVKRLS